MSYKQVSILGMLAWLTGMSFTAIAQAPPSNKPTGASQVPAPSGTVAATPASYITGGQSPKVNWVRERDAMGRITDTVTFATAAYTDVKETTRFFDGLGRPLQTVVRQITPGTNPSDLVTPVTYDAFGREVYKYLPYVQVDGNSSDGGFKRDPFTAQRQFYGAVYMQEQPAYVGEQVFYSQTQYEASPLNRPLKSMAPGNSWAGSGKGVSQQYLVNAAADSVVMWNIANDTLSYLGNDITTNIPVAAGYYPAGQLFKNLTVDEQGHAVVEYKDKEGQVVLKKMQVGTVATDYSGYHGWLSTYYVYDDRDQLRFALSPKAVTIVYGNSWNLAADTTTISELCFRYEYDSRRRMTAKKVPGAAWNYMIYDQGDRLVFIQDGNLRARNQWMTTLYDELNRPTTTGMITYSGNPSQLQQYVTTHTGAGTSGTVTVNGTTPFSLPQDVNLVDPAANGDWRALNMITLDNGFETPTTVDFTAEIVTGTTAGNAFTNILSVLDNPLPPAANFIALTMTFYDDYHNTPDKQYTSFYNSFLDAGANQHAEQSPSVSDQQTVQTIGMATATKVRVIEDPADLTKGQWLATINFYDDRGRVIQTQSDNYRGSTDKVTNRYNFTGQVISSFYHHLNPAALTNNNTRIKTNFNYDHAGRLLEVYKSINEADSTKRLIVRNDYDQRGQLKQKHLGQLPADGSFLETQDYGYNIRGWLKGINKDYTNNDNSHSANNRWFGMELSYDWGFGSNQLNGNISGNKWRSKGDGQQRAYGFGYDATNRLLYGDFNQYSGSGWDRTAGLDFSTIMGNGVDPNTAYDENGNIKAMLQSGWQLGGSHPIDSLSYTYYANSNKLKNVIDGRNDALATMGDFRTSSLSPYNTGKTNTAIDYVYDVNGNMTRDLNKDIGSQTTDGITYNHLNLPWQVKVRNATGTKGMITYIYDAAGNKLKKTTADSAGSMQTVTTYMGPFQYQGKRATGANNGAPADTLQLISQEEGRIRVASDTTGGQAKTSFKYDYFIKDHLGNTRMVLTDEQQTDRYPAATMESGAAATENLFYSKLDNTRTALPAGYPSDTTTNPNQNVARLNGGTAGPKIGPGMTLKVMAGDQFSIRASSWYRLNGTSPGTPANPLSDLLVALISGIGALPGGGHPSPAMLQANSTPISDNLTEFLSDTGASINSSRPHAFLNWVLFDEQFNYVAESSGFEQVGGDQEFKKHVRLNLPVTKSGYLYIYLSNETPNIDVYFDNLQVTHTRGPLLEENHYYPFGLTMAGISDKASKGGYATNRLKYNGANELESQEFSDGTGLEWYDAVHRMYDPQTGRFGQVDEFGEANIEGSPYSFANNNPIRFNDPYGLFSEEYKKKKKKHGFSEDDPNVLNTAVVTGRHSQANLEFTYWYYVNNKISFDKAPKSIQNWLYRQDKLEHYLETVHENIRTQGIIVANAASFLIPVGEIVQIARLGRVVQLFKLRRGAALLGGYGSDAAIVSAMEHVVPKRGWYDVIIHGTEDGLAFAMDGQQVTAEQLYAKMVEDGYTQGTKVRLLSCYSGMLEQGGAAQQLSKLTESMVVAPKNYLGIGTGTGFLKSGEFMIGGGEGWRLFKP
jgi:RHS repeat-associated protein